MAIENTNAPSTLAATYNNTPRLPHTASLVPPTKDSMQLSWSYAAVQHSNHVAVHRAAYSADNVLITVSPTPETLTDVSTEHLTDFLSQVMVGITNKPAIDAETFQRMSADYAAVNAEEQAAILAEEKTA